MLTKSQSVSAIQILNIIALYHLTILSGQSYSFFSNKNKFMFKQSLACVNVSYFLALLIEAKARAVVCPSSLLFACLWWVWPAWTSHTSVNIDAGAASALRLWPLTERWADTGLWDRADQADLWTVVRARVDLNAKIVVVLCDGSDLIKEILNSKNDAKLNDFIYWGYLRVLKRLGLSFLDYID